MWRTGTIAAALLLAGCANGGRGVKAEVDAVVQDETARQAAGVALQQGEGSKDALKAAAEATDKSKDEARPPN